MIFQNWAEVFQQTLFNLFWGTATFLPNFLLAVVIFILGWYIGSFVGHIINEAVRALKVDHALRMSGFDAVVNRAGYSLNSGAFVGALVKWFIVLAFLLASLQVLGLSVVTFFLQQVVLSFLPNVIIAVLILLGGAVVGEVMQNVVTGSARAAGITAAGFAGVVARWAVWLFAILAALEQLQIAQMILQTLFTGVVVALALAFGLAFGLGGQESAARFLEKTRQEMSEGR